MGKLSVRTFTTDASVHGPPRPPSYERTSPSLTSPAAALSPPSHASTASSTASGRTAAEKPGGSATRGTAGPRPRRRAPHRLLRGAPTAGRRSRRSNPRGPAQEETGGAPERVDDLCVPRRAGRVSARRTHTTRGASRRPWRWPIGCRRRRTGRRRHRRRLRRRDVVYRVEEADKVAPRLVRVLGRAGDVPLERLGKRGGSRSDSRETVSSEEKVKILPSSAHQLPTRDAQRVAQ